MAGHSIYSSATTSSLSIGAIPLLQVHAALAAADPASAQQPPAQPDVADAHDARPPVRFSALFCPFLEFPDLVYGYLRAHPYRNVCMPPLSQIPWP